MTTLRVIGVDPGPVPGIVVLDLDEGPAGRWLREVQAFQCTANAAPYLVEALLIEHGDPALVAVEKFVVGGRSGQLASAHESATTRDLVGALEQAVRAHHRGVISGQTAAFV